MLGGAAPGLDTILSAIRVGLTAARSPADNIERLKQPLDRLYDVTMEVNLFLRESGSVIGLFRVVFGQFRKQSHLFADQLRSAVGELDLSINASNRADLKEIKHLINKVIENAIDRTRTFALVRDTYMATEQKVLTTDLKLDSLDSTIRKFFSQRDYILAISPLNSHFLKAIGQDPPNTNEAKKAALYLGHCHRICAENAVNSDSGYLDLATTWYTKAFDMGSITATIYLAKIAASQGKAQLAEDYLSKYVKSQEPDRTLSRSL
ncbi:hypothetical protein HDU96_010916 [Phlyctochytrium bullatum]|nr:hypothetical protein HDU96_010916 [Phlyctochytrium bullatum]